MFVSRSLTLSLSGVKFTQRVSKSQKETTEVD